MLFKVLAVAGWAAILGGMSVQAQTKAAASGPSEIPPASYSAAEYIDGRGCIFVRAVVGGRTTWVAQVSADRKPLCGFAPTFGAPKIAKVAGEQPAGAKAVAKRSAKAPRKSAAAAKARTVIRIDAPTPGRRQSTVLKGYKPAWKDGRLNPLRGVGTAAGQAAQDQIWTRDVPAELVVPKDSSPKRVVRSTSNQGVGAGLGGSKMYVQVGVFGQPANAKGASQRLARMGLPVASAQTRQGRAILAGPFTNRADANAALSIARQSGFVEAFIK